MTVTTVVTNNGETLAQRIDTLLPQTQCRQCGYAGCQPYAEAITQGKADINRCPPGGDAVIADLAHLLKRPAPPLDLSCGVNKAPAVALIDEAWCIGCTLCIQACPVDAIVGAAKVMHTVIAAECTGCELCIPPCPVDCIAMVPVARDEERDARLARAAHARSRHDARNERLAHLARLAQLASNAQKAQRAAHLPLDEQAQKKHAAVARALQRARERLQKTQ